MIGRVLITAKSVMSSAGALNIMREAGCDLVILNSPIPFEEEWVIEQMEKYNPDAIIFTMEPTSRAVLEAAPNLKIVGRPAVGYDTVDINACNQRKIPVATSPVNDASVADFAFGLLLDVARRIGFVANSVQQGGWEKPVGTEVWNKTIAIIGLGRIGKGVARRARGFDMRVLAVDDYQDQEFAETNGLNYVDLDTALAEADFISLHAPLLDDTRDMINAASIAKMKPGAYIINTARAGLIDEEALAEAVKSGHLGGAAVDVIKQPGAGTSSPLVNVPNILVTTHIATYSKEAIERVAQRVAENVVATLQGSRPQGVVNPEIYEN